MFFADLILDARYLSSPNTGIYRFTKGLIEEIIISKTAKDMKIMILFSQNSLDREKKLVSLINNNKNLDLKIVSDNKSKIYNFFFLPFFLSKLKYKNYFYPNIDIPVFNFANKYFVVHDLKPIFQKDYFLKYKFIKRNYFYFSVLLSLLVSKKCFAVSETTKKDLINVFGKFFEKKIEVCYEGCNFNYQINIEDSKIKKYGKFLVYVGDRRPHKNLKKLIDIFNETNKKINKELNLLIIGPSKNYDFDLPKYVEGEKNIFLLTDITDDELPIYYSKAEALLFLSTYEGFGLPVIEALRCNTKVITSDGGSLREVNPFKEFIIPLHKNVDESSKILLKLLKKEKPFLDKKYFDRFSWNYALKKILKEMN